MLLVALISLLMAALFLFLEVRQYGGFGTVKGPSGAALYTAPAIIQAA
jgi:hypothetical protein